MEHHWQKTGGKSRASTPLSKYETEYLIHSLIDKNSSYQFYPSNPQNTYTNLNNELNNFCFSIGTNEDSFVNIILNNIIHRDGEFFRYEKSMEMLFNWLLKTRNTIVCNQLNIDVRKISWFANYLPYGIERSEIDYMVMLSEDAHNDSECKIIEFQTGNLDEDHLKRVFLYSKWAKENIFKGKQIVTPVIICKGLPRNIEFLRNYDINKVELYGYAFIGNNNIRFTRLLPHL